MNKRRFPVYSVIALIVAWPSVLLGYERGGWVGATIGYFLAWAVIVLLLYSLVGLANRLANRFKQSRSPERALNHRLRSYDLWFQIVLGVIAFSALFSSQAPASEKIFFSAALLLLVGLHDLQSLADVHDGRMKNRLRYLQFRNLECQIKGEQFDWNEEESKLLSQALLEDRWSGSGAIEVRMLLIKNLIWIGGGWLISRIL